MGGVGVSRVRKDKLGWTTRDVVAVEEETFQCFHVLSDIKQNSCLLASTNSRLYIYPKIEHHSLKNSYSMTR